jgi:hypothetical protein
LLGTDRKPHAVGIEDVRLAAAQAHMDLGPDRNPDPAIDHGAEIVAVGEQVQQGLGTHRLDDVDGRGQRPGIRLVAWLPGAR